MKMTPEHYAELESACMDTLKANGLHPFMVNGTQHVWDVFAAAARAGRIDCTTFYEFYSDSHIETALKRIFKR